jgi:apolipoprotein D and lipocalin family protein
MRRFIGYLICFVLASMGLARAADAPVRTVPALDLQRYLGTWYEIGNYPMFFQRKCVGDTTAVYSLNADGSIKVQNSCHTKDGSIDSAEGRATVVKGSQGSKLEVSFFRPFKGDYWVIGLDPDYRWAVVGDPARKYLWILSRTPQLAAADLERALASARAQGYTLKELRYTPQSAR